MNDMQKTNDRVGYAFVPLQIFGETYSPEQGIERGTIFPDLDLPISVYGVKPE
ncbi:MAG: spore coat associated protein CotJA [Ruminococcaceae bacterium]|nr:spore coat associated protein CotJA [Oscillospiraceae bacterium]